MARRPAVLRAQPCALAAAAALALACALYYAGSGPAQRALPPPPAPPSPSPAAPAPESKAKAGEELLRAEAAELHVLAVLAKAEHNEALRAKAAAALRSLVRFGKLGPREALALHLLCDGPSRSPARQLLQQALRPAAFKYKVGQGGSPPLPSLLRRPAGPCELAQRQLFPDSGAAELGCLREAPGRGLLRPRPQSRPLGSAWQLSQAESLVLWWEGGSGSPSWARLPERTGGARRPL